MAFDEITKLLNEGKEAYEGNKTINDGFETIHMMDEHMMDKGWNGAQGTEGGPLSIVNGLLDTYKVGKGVFGLHDGIENGDAVRDLGGVHDLLDGGSGLLGNFDNPIGDLAKAFNMGLSGGDALAPYVFGDGTGSHTEAPSEDGLYHAHTGNGSVDDVLDGARQLSNGDYADGAKNVLEGGGKGLLSAEQLALNPLSMVPGVVSNMDGDHAIDLAKKAYDVEQRAINPLGGFTEKAGQAIGGWLVGKD